MNLQEAFDAAQRQYPQVVDDRELLGTSGFWQRWSLVDAADESGDPARRGQLVLHEVRFSRCYETDGAENDRYETETSPRNHWGFQVPETEFAAYREAISSNARFPQPYAYRQGAF